MTTRVRLLGTRVQQLCREDENMQLRVSDMDERVPTLPPASPAALLPPPCCQAHPLSTPSPGAAAVPRTHIDDEYAHAGERDPKILITTSRDPSSRLVQFAKEVKLLLPNSQRVNRGSMVSPAQADGSTLQGPRLAGGRRPGAPGCCCCVPAPGLQGPPLGLACTPAVPRSRKLATSRRLSGFRWRPRACRPHWRAQVVGELVESCRAHDYTDLVMVHEHRGEPDGLVVCHLPYGPTAYFGIFNTVLRHDIGDKKQVRPGAGARGWGGAATPRGLRAVLHSSSGA